MLITQICSCRVTHSQNPPKKPKKKTNLEALMLLKIYAWHEPNFEFGSVCMCVCICTSMWTCALVPVHLCVWALISMSRSSRLRQMLIAFVVCMTVCAYTYSYDVNKVIFSQGVQDCINGVLGYCQSQSLHAATDIHDDYYIFRRCGCLYIPKRT